ncbi:MAG: hypothetical protein JWO06_3508, partial [Bacteroidota bacterium]|nr:hypothetical protein [Bacteroidota bacterium]
YLPLKEGFLITSNRDERLLRKAAGKPELARTSTTQLLFPRDGEAGGTWIATSENGRTVCLLNGAFLPHRHQPPYRKSRGLVVLEFFDANTIFDFNERYDLSGIEPFTILVAENKKLYELRWDGAQKHFKTLDENKPHIRCSVTLYTPEVIAMREEWFANWLKSHDKYLVEEILQFHLFAGEGDKATQVRMSRAGIVQTVSITCVETGTDVHRMYYSPIQEGQENFYFGTYSFKNKEDNTTLSFTAARK